MIAGGVEGVTLDNKETDDKPEETKPAPPPEPKPTPPTETKPTERNSIANMFKKVKP